MRLVRLDEYPPQGVEWLLDAEPIPRDEIEDRASQLPVLAYLLEHWHDVPAPDQPLPMTLPAEQVRASRKTREFYERVAYYVNFCDLHSIAAGPRLAQDNGVSENTVYGWVRKARALGFTIGANR